MDIVKYDEFPCFFVNMSPGTGRGLNVDALISEKEFKEKQNEVRFIARFENQSGMNAFMRVFTNQQGFERDEIKENRERWGNRTEIIKTGRRVCFVDERLPWESIKLIIQSGKHVKITWQKGKN